MKTLCLLESVSRMDGGIFEAELALQRKLFQEEGVGVDVIGLEDRYASEDLSRWLPLKPKVVKMQGAEAFGYSADLFPSLDQDADLLYAATLWRYPSWAALRWVKKTGKPMMATPHGSMSPWALNHSAWKKRIAASLFKDRQLQRATCLRALSQTEADDLRSYGLTNPIAIIPNGIAIHGLGDRHRMKQKKSVRKTLLFLGRIHPKKGLVNLLKAWSKAGNTDDWRLVIAGWDQGGHEAELMRLCEELGLSYNYKMQRSHKTDVDDVVLFHGPAFGDDKVDLLESSDAFVLPSLSEGLPMSVLEAWANRLPVVLTPECNLPEGIAVGAALSISADIESIARGLQELFLMSEEELCSMGQRGCELVKERFNWCEIAVQMKEVYSWMLGGGTKPSCIIVN